MTSRKALALRCKHIVTNTPADNACNSSRTILKSKEQRQVWPEVLDFLPLTVVEFDFQ
jgi:hypothetical protein